MTAPTTGLRCCLGLCTINLTAAAEVLSGEDWTEIETDNNAMTKRVVIEEGGFGNRTGPRGIGGGSNPTGGEFTEEITGRVMQGIKELGPVFTRAQYSFSDDS